MNGERAGKGRFAASPREDEFVWTKIVGDQQCVVRIGATIGCAPKIVGLQWLSTGIYWEEETDKSWRVHPPSGKVREFPLPKTHMRMFELDDLGGFWWMADGNVYNEKSPGKPVISPGVEHLQGGEGISWDPWAKAIPGARSGELLRRDAGSQTAFLPWKRTAPFDRDFEPYPLEGRGDADYSIICGHDLLTLRMVARPEKGAGMFSGQLWLLGVLDGKDSTAVFLDCSKNPPERAEMPVPQISTETQLVRPLWLGDAPPPFRFVRSVYGAHRPVDYYMAVPPGAPKWAWLGPDDLVGEDPVSYTVWLSGPPYWAGWWQWNQRRSGITVSWVAESLDFRAVLTSAGKQDKAGP